jgi:bifunctional non-homologous end joining protein LigD
MTPPGPQPLDEYHRKRDFSATPEPAGAPAAGDGASGVGEDAPAAGAAPLSFVMHEHAARSLHYDLRLEVGGVYASWAVPKGPSLDPAQKRLAVHVEDHPLEYGSFEGTIPTGEYGAGTVMVWDRGTFTPVGDPASGIAKGDFKFTLSGTKLNGMWVLVRMKPRPGERQEAWLLIKERDEHVRPHAEYDVLAAEPDSAATGRTMEQIAAGDAAGPGAAGSSPKDAPDAPFPLDAPFQLATLVDEAPDGDEWAHEVKYDGYRLRIALTGGGARALTRNGEDWSERFPTLVDAARTLPAVSALLDGEAVVFDADGRSDFGLLQEALSAQEAVAVRFEAFDLLYLDGHDLRGETLLRRAALLHSLLDGLPESAPLREVERFPGHGPDFHAASCRLLLEGSVSKRGDRPWVPGRTRDWLKVKCLARQEFVIGGWTDPAGSRAGFGALLLGVPDGAGRLRYAGRVGTGFTDRSLATLKARLAAIATDTPPFADPPRAGRTHWARPELVAEVAFREWTRDGLLRQASFKGLREDKAPSEVTREQAAADPPSDIGPGPATVRGLTVTNPDRVLEPAGVTKLELARYYDAVADWMLPHAVGRPLTIVRCPHGAADDAGCFYQKHPESRGWPDVFGTVEIVDREGPAVYFFVKDAAGLVALAQLGTLEVHTWSSLAADPERPDRIVFDLDPGPGVEFAQVADGARTVRDALAALGLAAFVKTTGGHGLHVVSPIVPERGWDEVRAFAHGLVEVLARERADRFTVLASKEERPGRVFVDYLRNAHGATAVCAYSTRARPGAHVSVPVTWDELELGIDPASFDVHSVPARLAALAADPWGGYEAARVRLDGAALTAVGTPPPAPHDRAGAGR